MAVHISEIGVKLAVGGRPVAPAADAAPGSTPPQIGPERAEQIVEEIVAEAVRRVLDQLRAAEAR